MDEYRTVNVDLAAALVTYGVELKAVETKDGVTCEFVFLPTCTYAERGSQGEAVPVPTSDVAAEWGDADLLVGARELTANIRRMHFKVREAQNIYARARTNKR